MANASAKKSAKAGQAASQKYMLPIILSTSLYVLWRLIWNYHSSTWFDYLLFLIMCLLHGVAFYGLVFASENNLGGEYYFDIYVVNVCSQILSTIFIWGWIVLLIIPAYALYIGFGMYQTYRKSQISQPSPIEEDVDSSNNSKANRSQPRAKIRNIRS